MLYDIRLRLFTTITTGGGRRQPPSGSRRAPTMPSAQRVVAASLSFCRHRRNARISSISSATASHRSLSGQFMTRSTSSMSARVAVSRPDPGLDVSPEVQATAQAKLRSYWSLAADAPHHFVAPAGTSALDGDDNGLCRNSLASSLGVGRRHDICNRIHRDFAYDGKATTVATKAADAFDLKRGVCQDFSHVMIAGLRGLGIPAGYVSGFLRTIPPPGKERLEGADAMHAWVKVWCGREAGWHRVRSDQRHARQQRPYHGGIRPRLFGRGADRRCAEDDRRTEGGAIRRRHPCWLVRPDRCLPSRFGAGKAGLPRAKLR